MREGWGNHYYHDLPFLQYDQILANFPRAFELGFLAAYGEGTKNFSATAPNYWALTRMMWNPERDTTRLMDDFYRAAYGPAADEMRAFFETYNSALNENWMKRRKVIDTPGIAYANIITSWHALIPRSAVEKADAHLKAAEKKAPPGEYADRVAFHRFGQDYTAVMLEILDSYRQLGELGVKLDTFSTLKEKTRDEPAERDRVLKRAFDLGEKREAMLLAHRDWAGPDEGLYGFTNDGKLRQWHAAVKAALGIDKPTAVTKALLAK